MPPPLPPSSKAPRIRKTSNDKQRNSGISDELAQRLASRRLREDDVRPSTSSGSSGQTALPTTSKSKTTTEDEIGRIREIRERRKLAERIDHDEKQQGVSARRPPIARGDLDKSGSLMSARRQQFGDTSNSGDDETINTDVGSKRSEIQARLAARRRQAAAKDGIVPQRNDSPLSSSGNDHSTVDTDKRSAIQERLAARRRMAGRSEGSKVGEVPNRDTIQDDIVSKRSEIQARLAAARRRRAGIAEELTSRSKEATSSRVTNATKDEVHSNIQARLAARREMRKSVDGPNNKSTIEISNRSNESSNDGRNNRNLASRSRSSDRVDNRASIKEEQPQAKNSEERKITTSAEESSVASFNSTSQANRSSSLAISERLRERREARERERKAREKKDSEETSTESVVTQPRKKAAVTESISKDEIKPRRVNKNTAERQVMSSSMNNSSTKGEWSVRLCVISAMDLPSNIVPNMPLCPILKMCLVELPTATSGRMELLGENVFETVNSSMTRSTTQKILSRRDNGMVDFHQEYRWDDVNEPRAMGLCVELFALAVNTPTNYMLSPPAISQNNVDNARENVLATNGGSKGIGSSDGSIDGSKRGIRSRDTSNKKKNIEMEAAEAAAAMARLLVGESGTENGDDPNAASKNCSEKSYHDVSLSNVFEMDNEDLTKDVRLGAVVIPLTRLPQDKKGFNKNETVRLEKWHQLDMGKSSSDIMNERKTPSVLLEISLSSSVVLDESEDEMEEDNDDNAERKASSRTNISFSRRTCIESLNQTDKEEKKKDKPKTEDPTLEPGVVDFIAVVGCKDIGNQKNDDGMKGWVKTTPDCVVLEQFPPNNDFHLQSGRKALLPEMLQWFCYPEGAKLWRGIVPPSHNDLNLRPFSRASPPNVPSSNAAFDACLDCATSFSWFVIASNSDEYGSSLVKTYGAVIRFYVPAPMGIDSTQDDFAQAIMGGKLNLPISSAVKRLWVPIAICLTSNLPIVGVMEALLLRTCEELAMLSGGSLSAKLEEIQEALGNIIVNYQKPVSGAVNCSVPFLNGERFLLSLPPSVGLPPLPHGRAITSVCRLLGAEGLNYLLAAVLTECKILLHSDDIAEIAMVAEVITALTYPFAWSLPYIPVLPVGMIEFVEAPLSYLSGIPSSNLKLIDPHALDDTVVFDLNKKFSPSDYSSEKLKSKTSGSKHPHPLPVPIARNLFNATHKLLQAEEEMEEELDGFELQQQGLPRLENESFAEREFRVTVAVQICGLLRGYQDCMGPVFNSDKFLKTAPALYDEKREYRITTGRLSGRTTNADKAKDLSSRSKQFLSALVSGQNFQQFIEILETEEASFFHEVLKALEEATSERKTMKRSISSDENDSNQIDKTVVSLMKALQRNEDNVPTFCVEKGGNSGAASGKQDEQTLLSQMYGDFEFDNLHDSYPNTDPVDPSSNCLKDLLSPIEVESTAAVSDSGMQAVSMEYLTKLETSPWVYNPLFNNVVEATNPSERVKLREAIGEKRFRAWKMARDKKSSRDDNLGFLSQGTTESAKQGSALDLTTLVSSAKNDTTDPSTLSSESIQLRMSSLTPAQQRIAAAKSRDIIRRCLDKANVAHNSESDRANPFVENGRDLMAEAEKALRNPSAQLFLVSILAQRSRLENKRTRTMRHSPTISNSASRLDIIAFDCLIRLSCAMLDSCMEYKDFEMAYRLLTNSAGFIMVQEVVLEEENNEFSNEKSVVIISLASRVGLHPIFADIGVWEAVMALHLRDHKMMMKSDEFKSYNDDSDEEEQEEVEYEAAVSTLYEMVGYGIPGEELSRFAMRANQKHGWFSDDRGRQLLMLARRISVRRDQGDMVGTGNTGDIDMVRKGADDSEVNERRSAGSSSKENSHMIWSDVAWCHPAAHHHTAAPRSNESDTNLEANSHANNFMKRTPITALAAFGSSIVASGGLDGGVFLAHSITFGSKTNDPSDSCAKDSRVEGIHLDWGSASRARTGSTSDGEYGVGAVSCLAASCGDTAHDTNTASSTKDTKDAANPVGLTESIEGYRIIAGTTAGDLRVWSVKDVYASISLSKNDQETRNSHNASRYKYALRGRALSGHRGGVTCIDIPSQVYRPDSLVTGGADGLIKIWALRARGGEALSNLSGHSGRILCIKTAWHGDHLLSGGADRTIRVWDLATSGGKCIHKLFGHFGWITNVQYWGPNTIVSASTDRSVALWDARVKSAPLFLLRNHQSPISDLLVGSRTDPYMVSAGADGMIATWDFRSLSNTTTAKQSRTKDSSSNGCRIVRVPSASIRHDTKMRQNAVGSIRLSRDVTDPMNSFLSVGSDAILRKWNIATGNMVDESPTGHCDAITSFESYAQSNGGFGLHYDNPGDFGGCNSPATLSDIGFLTSSLDGTVRMRKIFESKED